MMAGLAHPEQERSMVGWLREIHVIPDNASAYTSPKQLGSGLNEEEIPAEYLAQFAYNFDKEGESTPVEFANALAFEVKGTPQRKNFNAMMEKLTGEARE